MNGHERVIDSYRTQDGELLVGGVPLARLTQRVGSTPYFAYDRERLLERVSRVRDAIPPSVQLSYAVKANPFVPVVQALAQVVDRFDVASGRELRTALDTTVPASRVSFAGPGKSRQELAQAVAAGATIELESRGEAVRVAETGNALGIRPRVAVRVNPDFVVKGSGMRMGGGAQQFGVDAEAVPDLLRWLGDADVDLLGFHVFAGSQNLSAEVLADAQRRTVDLVIELAAGCVDPVRYVNLGGGFGIPYFEKDSPLDLEAVGAGLAAAVDRLGLALPEAQPVIELGRYLVGEAGVYVTRVIDRKESRGQIFLVVDGGLHHQLAASGNFGQVIRRNYPLAVGNRMGEVPRVPTNVVGKSCTPLDLLGDRVELPLATEGDLVVVFQAGAYGLTASPTAFLSHPEAVEVLVGDAPAKETS